MIRSLTLVFVLASATVAMAQTPEKKTLKKAAADEQAQPLQKKEAKVDLSSTRLKASYGIGVSIGKNLKSEGLEVDLETLMEGIRTIFSGEKPALEINEIRMAITAFQQEMQIKLAAKRKIQGEANKKEGAAFLAANGKKAGIITTDSGLQYEVIKSGNGKSPSRSNRVKTHYHGTLLDGTVFDSSVDRDEPISFAVGGVIAGWTEALQLMKVGDKWRLFVPAELAYAERGAGDDIGPHATLVFEVELLGIE